MSTDAPRVDRHKAAIVRQQLSRPVRLALEAEILQPERSFLDYGCGRGDDIRRLEAHGIRGRGWDPYYAPKVALKSAQVVNLGFVLNVVENPMERAEALRKAWELTESVLIVAVQVYQFHRNVSGAPLADGVVTRRNTFQKFFDHSELGDYVRTVLDRAPVSAGVGVFFVFRDPEQEFTYRSRRRRRRIAAPRLPTSVVRFEEQKELLTPLMEFFEDHGRLPETGEVDFENSINEEFGSTGRALALIRRATGRERWEEAQTARRQELLVFLGLSLFGGRARMSELPRPLQLDVRKLFGSHKKACKQADELLFQLGDFKLIADAGKQASVGKRLPEHLYVHVSAVDALPPLRRMYEGCARSFIGEIEEANLVKLNMKQPVVSYLEYPGFDRVPHPVLATSVNVNLVNRRVITRDYTERENPPVLHRKELFVSADYPGRDKFSRLTKAEQRHRLLSNSRNIGTLKGWQERLEQAGFALRGHRLIKVRNT